MDKNRERNGFIGLYIVALTVASACIVSDGANGEPYVEFHHGDAFRQVGVAVALIVLWLQFAGWLLYGVVVTHRLTKPWLALAILIGIALFYLQDCPVGYFGDITRYVVEKHW